MSAARQAAPATNNVLIQDRRELPFFQVRLKAVHAIRNEVSGPRRLRAIGFYALLCQLANEQRHTGEQRLVQFTYEELATRGSTAKRNVKLMLDYLERAGVVRYERLADPERGAAISILHLLIQEGPWTAITVAMADRLASDRIDGHLLRDIGLTIVLLQFCLAQRKQLDGLSTEIPRGEIALHAGITVDRVDDCVRVLQAAGVLSVTRRRAANGGRNLPNLYSIHEAPSTSDQGGETEPAGPRNGTGKAAKRNWQGGGTELAGRRSETGRAADGNSHGGISATPRSETRPSSARGGWAVEEKAIEQTPTPSVDGEGGGEKEVEPVHGLCQSFVDAWEPVLGSTPAAQYAADRDQWTASAARLLERHSRERLGRALEQMLVDEIVGSRALTMPSFERVVDRLIAREHAHRRRSPAAVSGPSGGRLGWPEARQELERAIQRHGRDHRDRALRELAAINPKLVTFVERVRWSTLCEQPIRFVERRYSQLWSNITQESLEEQDSAA